MDSLLSNYASSSDEEEQHQQTLSRPNLSSSSKPPSLPSLSTLPPPKSHQSKRVVQFQPPINPYALHAAGDDDDDDEDDQKDRKRRRDSQSQPLPPGSGKSLLSMIPAPKNSLSLGSSASGRRATVVAAQPVQDSFDADANATVAEVPNTQDFDPGSDPNAANHAYYDNSYSQPEEASSYYGGWVGGQEAAGAVEENPGSSDAILMGIGMREMGRRRGRNDMVEVKQEELIKNRPRQDQASLTGIAFGPSYPGVSAAKGKPSKLHKRKHQIGTLYFDMKQKEQELSERRSRGFLTKAETQAKYGW